MKRIFYLFAIVLSINFAQAASFDCGKARTLIEKAICEDVSLGEIDKRLNSTYISLRSNLSEEAKLSLRNHQVRWLRDLSSKNSQCLQLSKDKVKFVACLSDAYKRRTAFLEKYLKPIGGFYKYPSLAKDSRVEVEFIDGDLAAARLVKKIVNDKVKELAQASQPIVTGSAADDEEDSLSVEIIELSGNIAKIESDLTLRNGHPMPLTSRSWSYIDLKSAKTLSGDFFFRKDSLDLIAKTFAQRIRAGARKDDLWCYDSFDEASIKKMLTEDLYSFNIKADKISIYLSLVRACKHLDETIEIPASELRKHYSNEFLALISKS